MTATTFCPDDPEGPVAIVLDARFVRLAVRVAADHDHGLVNIRVAAEPGVRVQVAPEAALALSLALVSAVNDLRHAGRGSRP